MMKKFATDLISWYEDNKRDLPWRNTNDPYHIWVSEIMLQQTRVEAVKPYYARFLSSFPTITDLANASEESLFKLWEGLGYYSRARNLQKAAKECVSRYNGVLPSSYGALLSLSGIGPYTAGAIASFAFHLPYPAIDGNVLRVLGRYLAIEDFITLPKSKKAIEAFILQEMPEKECAAFNQALMELGATVCGPDKAARCGGCPLVASCKAFKEGKTEILPRKMPKKEKRIEEKTVFVLHCKDKTALCKRPESGLLAGLFELPSVEKKLSLEEAKDYLSSLHLEIEKIEPLPDAQHIFTHIIWKMTGYQVICIREAHFDFYSEKERESKALPSAFSAFKPYL